MYLITHFTANPELKIDPTDYDPMTLEQAEELVTELNRDAIESSLDDRWFVVPQSQAK